MKGLKKLALASAIIAASSSAFAMQAMDDESLSAATGQDGLTITLDTNISNIDLFWRDADGLGPTSTVLPSGGTVLITGLSVTGTGTTINIDAGTNTNGSMLNIAVAISNLDIGVKDIYVGNAALYSATVLPTSGAVLSINNTINISSLNTTVQLGAGANHLMEMSGTLGTITLTGGLTINDLSVNGGGSIDLGDTTISGIVLNGTTVDVKAGGLVINTGAQTNVNVEIDSLSLGTAASIGSVRLANISSGANTITVTGH